MNYIVSMWAFFSCTEQSDTIVLNNMQAVNIIVNNKYE